MASEAKKIYLLRHGETAWSRAGRHTSMTDISLTENGREAARRLQPYLVKESFRAVSSSPLQRARETCELAGLGRVAVVEPDLVEWNYGDYEGLTTREIRLKRPDWSLFRDGCPGGETPAQVASRADGVIAKIKQIDGDVALFAHGHILRVLAARWINLPVGHAEHFLLDTATLNVLGFYYDSPALKIWNAPLVC
ncbi:MAG TPA: histidine phosphatase family protein [Terriglobales bacterium]|jgi:probable phosphoglycerate mutase|nr:histidine phosphatase family protein [Terriglobales bacterium]